MKAQKNKTMKDFHLDWFEMKFVTVNLTKAIRPRCAAQTAIQIVNPTMEWADDRPTAMTMLAIDNPCATVAAKIVKRPNGSISPTHHQGPLAQDVEGQPIARFWKIADMASHLPMVEEHKITL